MSEPTRLSFDDGQADHLGLASCSLQHNQMSVNSSLDQSDRHEAGPCGPDENDKKSLNKICVVCGEAGSGIYFGALVCLPCKSFFIRCTKDGPNPVFVCPANGNCDITKQNRLRCQSCRYQRCLEVGMARREKPEAILPSDGQELCQVCNDIANGTHFGVLTCEGCKKFFRRGLKEAEIYECKIGGQCTINPRSRNICRYCRFRKCLQVGMSREAIRMGRPKKNAVGSFDQEDQRNVNQPSESHATNRKCNFNEGNQLRELLSTSSIPAPVSTVPANQLWRNLSGSSLEEHSIQTGTQSGSYDSAQSQDTTETFVNFELDDMDTFLKTSGGEIYSTSQSWNDIMQQVMQNQLHFDNQLMEQSHQATLQNPEQMVPGNQHIHEAVPQSNVTHPVPDLFTTHTEAAPQIPMPIHHQQAKPQPPNCSGLVDESYGEAFRGQLNNPAESVGCCITGSYYDFFPQNTNCCHVKTGIERSLPEVQMDGRVHPNSAGYPEYTYEPQYNELPVMPISAQAGQVGLPAMATFSQGRNRDHGTESSMIADTPQELQPTVPPTNEKSDRDSNEKENMWNGNDDGKSASGGCENCDCGNCKNGNGNKPGPRDTNNRKVRPSDDKGMQQKRRAPLYENASSKLFRPDYWAMEVDPSDTPVLCQKHNDLLNCIQAGYRQLVEDTDESKLGSMTQRPQTDKSWVNIPAAIANQIKNRIIRNLKASILFAYTIPDFSELSPPEQFNLCRYGGFHMMIVLAGREQYIPQEHTFKSFFSPPIPKKHPGYELRQELLACGQQIHAMKLDQREASCLSALSMVSTDWINLLERVKLEEIQKPVLEAFFAYVIDKHGSKIGKERIQEMLAIMPALRDLALWHSQYTKGMNFDLDETDLSNILSGCKIK